MLAAGRDTMVDVQSVPKRGSTPVVAMVGGGQLARMTHQAAIALGQTLRVLAVDPGDPAAQVSPDVVLGSHTDYDALQRVAAGATVLTFDHEHVPTEFLEKLVAGGVAVAPPPEALVHAQDKLTMRRKLAELGVRVPRFREITSADDVDEFGAEVGGAVVIKTIRGGYDGRGVVIADSVAQARQAAVDYLADGVPIVAEERIAMRRELAALVARSPFGQGAAWPVVETVQRDGICVEVVAPAPGLPEDVAGAAQRIGLTLAEKLGVVGVLAVELFETVDGELVVNELAMRPHNSGHWTMDGAATSQFEQHLRAVLDYPLGDTAAIAAVTVMANVLGAPQTPTMSVDERLHHLFARMPDAKVHLYGKAERPGRKLGHVNVLGRDGEDVASVRERATRAAHWLSHAQWTDGWDEHSGDDLRSAGE
jgi:5-(carboxyamino)imidazole ribonucleotide synthase